MSTGAARAQFELQGTNVTLLARRGAVATPGAYDYSSTYGSNTPMITLFSGSGLFQLQPGEWYLSAVNVSGGGVDYTIIASEYPVPGTNIVLRAGDTSNSGTNAGSFCINWNSLGGLYYYVEAKVALTDPVWTTISGLVTGLDGQTSWCVPLPSPYHFFRIRQWLGVATASSAPLPPSTPSISMGANGVTIRWSGVSTNKYQVQWTTSLATPSWNSFSNTVSSGNGAFSFTDSGSQSGGLGGARFYRLI